MLKIVILIAAVTLETEMDLEIGIIMRKTALEAVLSPITDRPETVMTEGTDLILKIALIITIVDLVVNPPIIVTIKIPIVDHAIQADRQTTIGINLTRQTENINRTIIKKIGRAHV